MHIIGYVFVWLTSSLGKSPSGLTENRYTALARSTLKIQIKVSMLSRMGPPKVFFDILKDLEVPLNEGSHFGYTQLGWV